MQKVRVYSIEQVTSDIKIFELVDPNGENLHRFSAGTNIDIMLPNGQMRQYSLCNDPAERYRYMTAVKREPDGRGGSKCFHDDVAVGDVLEISEPRNNFLLDQRAMHYTLIAGGIGITPLMAMAHKLKSLNKSFDFHGCFRSDDQVLFKSELEALVDPARLYFHITNGDPSRRLDVQALLKEPLKAAQVYCCGPQSMIDAVGLATKDWRRKTVKFEHFKPEPLDGTDNPFDVEIASTGQIVHVKSTETIFAALWKAGIQRNYSCEVGICRTCVAPYCRGLPEHRDQVLSGEERKREIAICVSRCKSDKLVLDI